MYKNAHKQKKNYNRFDFDVYLRDRPNTITKNQKTTQWHAI